MKAVEIDELSHRYGEKVALVDVTMDVEQGSLFGLVGPNGGGKSTIFNILSTLIRPSEGDARIFGHSVTQEQAKVRACIGVVFQSPALDKKLTVEENLSHQGYLYGISGGELKTRIKDKLQAVDVWDRRRDKVETLSGGLKRRVEIAKALLPKPRLLILDEPTTGLDPAIRRELRNLLKTSQNEGTTILMTTHLLDEAESCDKVAMLNEGRVVAMGTPGQLTSQIAESVFSLKVSDPGSIRDKVSSRFGDKAQWFDDELKIHTDDSPQEVWQSLDPMGAKVESMSFNRATLEDFFLLKTGNRLNAEAL